jgi:hypothetical protein
VLPILGIFSILSNAQPCTPQGNQTSFGNNDTWIGYVYDNQNFTSYRGYVTEGSPGNPNFNQQFGGDNVNYPTNGCSVNTNTFSVRYKLRKNFSPGGYQFTVGGDDGFRLSLDGGSTWVINRWQDQAFAQASYSVWLSGPVDMVLEYYENGGQNRIQFTVASTCMGSEDPSAYGNNDTWRGYVYDGTNFDGYKGMVMKGAPGNMSFDENFGGDNVFYNTSACSVQTETFSVRYRLRKNFPDGNYVFTVGGDDGYRLSLDGGNTWVINSWWDQSYNTQTYTANLSGMHELVLEYYENGGGNRISVSVQSNIILPIKLLQFSAIPVAGQVRLEWELSRDSDPSEFIVERSNDGRQFAPYLEVGARQGTTRNDRIWFQATDNDPFSTRTYYRLAMRDLQQKLSYSSVLRVENTADASGHWRLYPTLLTGDFINLIIPPGKQVQEWKLYDMNGRLMSQGRTGTGIQGQVLAIKPFVSRPPCGIYLLQVMDKNGETHTLRFGVQ